MALVITTVRFKSLVKLLLIFFFCLPIMQHHQGLSYTWLSMPLLMPLWLGVSPTAELSLIGAESPVMAEKLTERSIKWQLCYDISARTWWMVSALFALCPVLSRPCSSLRLFRVCFQVRICGRERYSEESFPDKRFWLQSKLSCQVPFTAFILIHFLRASLALTFVSFRPVALTQIIVNWVILQFSCTQ